MAVTLPPLSLSTGPAISGGPTESGGTATGNFSVIHGDTWSNRLMIVAPIILGGLGVLWLVTKKN